MIALGGTRIVGKNKDGLCWWYGEYAPGGTVLEGLEKEAREAGKGLRADPQPVPPWEWRKIRGLAATSDRYNGHNIRCRHP